MDWQQLYSAFDSHRRIKFFIHVLSDAERRQRKVVLVRGIIRRERRSRRRRVHFFNDCRDVRRRRLQTFMRVLFLFILLTISIATALIVFHIHPRYAAPLLFAYELLTLAFIVLKPRKRPQKGMIGNR